MPSETSSTVLLIEPDMSLRRLIALGLEHRGMQVIEISSLDALAEQSIADPDLLVLDIDNGYRDDTELLAAVQAHPYLSTLPSVVLAWEPNQVSTRSTTLPLLDCLGKPFDARTLHATIENLLETSAAIKNSPDQQFNASPATASVSVFSGLSPLLTAAGLLLTVIGIMTQLAITGAGLLIVLIGLLWWTLGKRPRRRVLLGEVRQKKYSPSLR
jgi:DNA-binding response OmpR family regulator